MKTKVFYLIILFLSIQISLSSQTPGTKKWEFTSLGQIYDLSPAIAKDGTIYLTCRDRGVFYAINPDGTKKWEYITGGPVFTSPSVGGDGTIYVGSSDQKLVAINPDGTKKWDYLTSGYSSNAPSIGVDGTILYAANGSNLYAFNADGTKKWEFPGLNASYWSTSPVFAADGTIYIASVFGKLFAISKEGNKKWELNTSYSIASMSIGEDGTLYFCPGPLGKKIIALNPDGTQKWEYLTGTYLKHSPVIGSDGTLYLGTNPLLAINPYGTLKWECWLETSCNVNSSPAIGADGVIYVNACSKLYAIRPDGTKIWENSEAGLNSFPAIGEDGSIYVAISNWKLGAISSSSHGLAKSVWPRYCNDNFNSSQFGGIALFNCDFTKIVQPNQTYNFKINILNSFSSDLSVKELRFSESGFGVSTFLPVSIKSGENKELTLSLSVPQNKWYKPIVSVLYNVGGVNYSRTFNLEGLIFLDDNSELAYVANQIMPVWKTLDKSNEIVFSNTKGIIYRLLADYASADSCFKVAASKSLIARYSYTGILMNTGVVKSDKLNPDSAKVYYAYALKDVQSSAATSVLAPQLYYNQAWEAYKSTNYTDASTLALQTINHSKANNYLKAKANVLLGSSKYFSGSYTEVKTSFNNAINLDLTGPIRKMAEENLKAILSPSIVRDLEDKYICNGTNYTIRCKVQGEPPLTYKWFRNDTLQTSYTTDSVKIIGFSTGKSGKYYCVVSNAYGSVTTNTVAINTYQPLTNPKITISGDTVLCQGQSVKLIAPVGYNYLWSDGKVAQVNSIVATGTYSVQLNPAGCSGVISAPVKIKVNLLPGSGQISGVTSVCPGQNTVLYTVPAISNATSYIWTLPAGATGSSTTNNITVNFGNSALSGNLKIRGHNACGDGPESYLAITVKPLPGDMVPISGPSTICSLPTNQSYEIPAIKNATSYIWTYPPGAIGTFNSNGVTVDFTAAAVSGNISARAHNSCGDGSTRTMAITVTRTPEGKGTIKGPDSVCPGQKALSFSVSNILYATSYEWNLPNGLIGTSKIDSIKVNAESFTGIGSINVRAINGCGWQWIGPKYVIANQLPGISDAIYGATSVCQGQNNVVYSVSSISNATSYIWTLPTGATGTSTTNSITVNYGTSAVSGIITVKGHNECGDGTATTKAITVNPLPASAGTITGTTTVCKVQNNVVYSVPAISNATSYIWTLPTGATGTSTTISISVNYGSSAVSGNVTVKGRNTCGDGVASTLAVTVNPIPATPVITLSGKVLHSDAPTGNQWYNLSNLIGGATAQDYTITTVGEYTVKVTLNGCASAISNMIKDVVTSIGTTKNEQKILVYPNPVADDLTVEYQGASDEIRYDIFSSSGQLVTSGVFRESMVIHTASFSDGIYLIKFNTGKSFEFRKVIKHN